MKKDKLSEKQEKFCQKYALLGNASESARSAGYASSSAKVQGHKLLQLPYILERIEELRSEMTTSYDVVKELEDQYAYAKKHGHTNSALKALDMLSRLRGNDPEVDELNKEESHNRIIGNLYIIGRKKVMEWLDEGEALGSEAVTRMMK
jgi:uncharacterized protein (UPF0335 family)